MFVAANGTCATKQKQEAIIVFFFESSLDGSVRRRWRCVSAAAVQSRLVLIAAVVFKFLTFADHVSFLAYYALVGELCDSMVMMMMSLGDNTTSTCASLNHRHIITLRRVVCSHDRCSLHSTQRSHTSDDDDGDVQRQCDLSRQRSLQCTSRRLVNERLSRSIEFECRSFDSMLTPHDF